MAAEAARAAHATDVRAAAVAEKETAARELRGVHATRQADLQRREAELDVSGSHPPEPEHSKALGCFERGMRSIP